MWIPQWCPIGWLSAWGSPAGTASLRTSSAADMTGMGTKEAGICAPALAPSVRSWIWMPTRFLSPSGPEKGHPLRQEYLHHHERPGQEQFPHRQGVEDGLDLRGRQRLSDVGFRDEQELCGLLPALELPELVGGVGRLRILSGQPCGFHSGVQSFHR